MVEWFIVLNALPDLTTELTNTEAYGKFIGFPFKTIGIAALLVLFLMAATSHDFWLAFLRPPVWKALHMLLYAAKINVYASSGVADGKGSFGYLIYVRPEDFEAAATALGL